MTLLNILKINPEIRKLFGRRELIIIEKQLLGVPLTDSERTRLSRDIRKKFEAIAKLSPYKDEFDLKKAANIKDIIQESIEIILESKFAHKIKKIVLFGSAAENTLTLSSDIDLAVEFIKTDNKEATQFRIEVIGKTNKRVDVQVFNVLPDKIKKEIKEKGKVVYEQTN
jgi:predicted nucleotidyltransferase